MTHKELRQASSPSQLLVVPHESVWVCPDQAMVPWIARSFKDARFPQNAVAFRLPPAPRCGRYRAP